MTWLDALAAKALDREPPTRAEALRVLTSTDDELMDVVAAAFKVRLRYFGRRVKLNCLQPLALHVVNSIFLGDYLTSEGQPGHRDLEMIADAGFTVEGAPDGTGPGDHRDLVRVRRRGAGTTLPANA